MTVNLRLAIVLTTLTIAVVAPSVEAQDPIRSPNDLDPQAARAAANQAAFDDILRNARAISEIDLTIAPPEGQLPEDRSNIVFQNQSDSFANRDWAILQFHWEASELTFQPPYWEQTPLERYGHTVSPRFQPLISGAHFFGTFPIIPYKIGIDRPFDRISVLGYYQPGSPTPCLRQRLPFEWDAALMEAGAWLAGIAIFP